MNQVDLPHIDTERRRQRSPRAPSFRYLVRLAVRCQSAEELGEQLHHRYDRQRQRAGLAQADRRRTDLPRSPSGSTGCWRIDPRLAQPAGTAP